MKTFIKVWCEWDFGQGEVIFSDERVAKNWLYATMLELEGQDFLDEEGLENEDSVFAKGLAGFEIIKLIEFSS